MMKRIFQYVALLLFLMPLCNGLPIHAQKPLSEQTRKKLKELDKVIEDKERCREAYTQSIRLLEERAQSESGEKRCQTYKEIYHKYARFQTDSALHYLELIQQMTDTTHHSSWNDFVQISETEVFAVTGLYSEALESLSKIHPDSLDAENRRNYYHLCRTLYGWMANYVISSKKRHQLLAATQQYRDSILKYEDNELGRNVVKADKAIVEGKYDHALQLSLADEKRAGDDLKPYIYFNLAECYAHFGDVDKQIYYLAQTAIVDIQRGVTEYEALGLLAQLLEKQGDVRRAYNYLICTMEDAAFCKARLRTIEASSIFPIVDKAYKQEEARQKHRNIIFICILAGTVLLLIASVIYLLRQKQRLTLTRQELATANAALQDVNETLQQVNQNLHATDKVKEEYIARYLNRCRDYLDTLENYRKELLKMAKAHQMEALHKALSSGVTIAEEKARFYEDFDNAFLTLYPNFIEKFNALLLPEAHITPKKGEQLTTELRIFALIRLGVNDSTKIAHFLNYSLATIYNYRSKLRGKSICGKDLFEEKVMEI